VAEGITRRIPPAFDNLKGAALPIRSSAQVAELVDALVSGTSG
jgi:hypothetical protein